MIEIVSYRAEWPTVFAAEAARLREVFPAPEFRIEHIGSTSVPGLSAKPTIDILIGAPDLTSIEARIPAAEELGYLYIAKYEDVLPDRRFLTRPHAPPRLFNVHAVQHGGEFWRRHLLFRDALRADPALLAEYQALKLELAPRFDDANDYADAKGSFIREVLERLSTSRAAGM